MDETFDSSLDSLDYSIPDSSLDIQLDESDFDVSGGFDVGGFETASEIGEFTIEPEISGELPPAMPADSADWDQLTELPSFEEHLETDIDTMMDNEPEPNSFVEPTEELTLEPGDFNEPAEELDLNIDDVLNEPEEQLDLNVDDLLNEPEEQMDLNVDDLLNESEEELDTDLSEFFDEPAEGTAEDLTDTGESLEETIEEGDASIADTVIDNKPIVEDAVSEESVDSLSVETDTDSSVDSTEILSEVQGETDLSADITETPEVPPREYDTFEQTVIENKPEFYETGSFYEQGVNEFGYTGTCGPTSQANALNELFGTNEFTENKVLNVAVDNNLCEVGSSPEMCGGTTTEQFMELYDKMDEQLGGKITTELYEFNDALDVEDVAAKLDEGCVLNVAVDANGLWDQPRDYVNSMGIPCDDFVSDHWITVTGVQRDELGNVQGFDIIDSGGGVDYVDADKYHEICFGTGEHKVLDPTAIVISKNDTHAV